jgi:cell division protein FtsL
MGLLLGILAVVCVAAFVYFYHHARFAFDQFSSDQMQHDFFRELSKGFAALSFGAAVSFATIGSESLVSLFAMLMLSAITSICLAVYWHYHQKIREADEEAELRQYQARTRAVQRPPADLDSVLVFAGLRQWARRRKLFI